MIGILLSQPILLLYHLRSILNSENQTFLMVDAPEKIDENRTNFRSKFLSWIFLLLLLVLIFLSLIILVLVLIQLFVVISVILL